MQMLQQVKTKDQANNSDVLASANCAGIPLSPNHFSLNSTIDGKTFTNETRIIDSGATEHMSYNTYFFLALKPLPKITSVRLPNSQTVKGPSMKSPMLLGESQNGLYIFKNRPPVASYSVNSCFKSSSSLDSLKDDKSSLACEAPLEGVEITARPLVPVAAQEEVVVNRF
ncbi:hypothetical protein KY285_028833 [Solanum tuberosum]|nr:hypothetical protein KY289_029011 [Solanum tuberosum]KAH0667627.1 hypothetical protein KY285_028833 [Solanum tuberosum]